MSKNMPMPSVAKTEIKSEKVDLSSTLSSSPEAPSKGGVSLEAPAHEELAVPKMATVESTISNSLIIDIPKGGIKVVATRKGFYNQNRIVIGQKFTVPSFDQVGTWMVCEDKLHEAKRLKLIEDKKKARK